MRKLSLSLMLVLLCTIVMPSALVNAVIEENSLDITSTGNYKKLEAFGILEEDDVLYGEYITRGLFAKVALKLSGYDVDMMDSNVVNPFNDLDENHEYYKEIIAAYEFGIVSGSSGLNFAPDDYITVEQAAKIITCILGYKQICEGRGGFPYGYVQTAYQIGVLPRKSGQTNSYISVEYLMTILLNTLETSMLQVDGMSLNNYDELTIKYREDREETLLKQKFNSYIAYGIVDANSYTSLYGSSRLENDQISIDGKVYNVNSSVVNVLDLIGCYVEFYYSEDDASQKQIKYIDAYKNKNDIVVVDYADIITEDVSNTKFSYYDNIKQKDIDINISRTAIMLYNGIQKKIAPEYLCPSYGNVTLIDNDTDGMFDVIKVMDYCIVLVSGISESTYMIADKLNGDSIELEPDNRLYDVIIKNDNETISFDQIEVGDIILYALGGNNSKVLKTIVVCKENISGIVNQISEDEIVIDDTAYSVRTSLLDSLKLGLSGTFYLDYTGRVIACQTEYSMVYGYLNALGKESRLSGTVKAQIFTENNRWVELPLKDKIKFSGSESKITAENFYNQYGGNPDDYRQLITYRVNDKGEIIAINFAETGFQPWSDEEKALIESDTFRLSRYLSSTTYRSGIRSFESSVGLTSDVKIFSIPDQTGNKRADTSEFNIVTSSVLVSDGKYSNVYVYDANEAAQSKICVLVGNELSDIDLSGFMVVEKVGGAMKDDGSITACVIGNYMGEDLTILAESEEEINAVGGLDEGDIIQFVLSENGYIRNINKRFSFSNGKEQKFLINNEYSVRTISAGCIKHVDRDNKRIVFDNGNTLILGTEQIQRVMVYDYENKNIIRGNENDLQEGDYIFARLKYYQLQDVIVLR